MKTSVQQGPIPLVPKSLSGILTITLLILLISVVAWHRSSSEYLRTSRDHFLESAKLSEFTLISRMQTYQQILLAGAGLFAVAPKIDRTQWKTFVDTLEVHAKLPGLQGIGFSVMLPPQERAKHEAAIRAEGFPSYSIKPADERPQLSAIIFIEPFTGKNLRAFGYDMYSEPLRRAAMERARDTANQALSAKVTLVQETKTDIQSGFLIYQPVYRRGMATDTVDARRNALLGFVYSPFRGKGLIGGIFNARYQETELELYDEKIAPDNLLFSSKDPRHTPRYMIDREIDIAGHRWIARFYSSQTLEAQTDSNEHWIILGSGIGYAFFVFAMLFINMKYQQRLVASATTLSKANRQLELLAISDALTGLNNRRSFDFRLQETFLESRRHHRSFSVLLLDIDHFKAVNDNFGHQIGDEVLKQFAQILVDQTRKTDFVARYGGEEFTVLLPEDDEDRGALLVAEKIRKTVASTSFAGIGKLTTSIGVAHSLATDRAEGDVVGRADLALYEAKQQGRNRTVSG